MSKAIVTLNCPKCTSAWNIVVSSDEPAPDDGCPICDKPFKPKMVWGVTMGKAKQVRVNRDELFIVGDDGRLIINENYARLQK